MFFRNRSIRVRVALTAIAAAVCVSLAPNVLTAQEKLSPSGGSDSATAQATDPVLVVTLGSINKLMQDVNYVTGAVGQPQAGGMFTMMVGTFTQGIDTTQPIGVIVPLVNGAPEPIALIPTTDIKTVLKRLEGQTGPTDELDDGTLVIAVGASTVFIRQTGNWAVLARNREILDLAPADPLSLFEGMGNDYDIAFRLRMQQVPVETRNMLANQIRQGFGQAMAQQQGGDAEAAAEIAENTMAQLEQVIQETDELQFGWNIEPSKKQIVMDGSFTAVQGSKLAAVYGSQQSIPSKFSSVIRDDAAAYYHAATSISPDAVEQTRTSLESSLSAVRNAIANEQNLTQDQQDEINEIIDSIADLAIDSVAEGKADLGALLLTDQNDFRFAFGSFVSDGNKAAEIVKDLAKKLENEPNAPRFKFDQGEHNGVKLHVIEADVPANQDEARRVFGETLRVHIGTGEKAVYLAIGNESDTLMKKLIDAGDNPQGGSRPIGQLRFTLLPILQYAQSIEPNDALSAMIDALSRSPDAGELKVVSDVIPNGTDTQIIIGEGLLHAVGAAIRASQPQPQF